MRIGARQSAAEWGKGALAPVAAGRLADLAPSAAQTMTAPPVRAQTGVGQNPLKQARDADCPEFKAKPRRNRRSFGRAAAHSLGAKTCLLSGCGPTASWRGEQLSPREGVTSCGPFSFHQHWRCAQPCQPVATPRVSRSPLAPAPGRLVQPCSGGICSPVLRSALQPISSIARKTQAAARATTAPVSLICLPRRATTDIHAGATAEPRAQLWRFAFRHTKEQGTANV